jgi:hypothetical protein
MPQASGEQILVQLNPEGILVYVHEHRSRRARQVELVGRYESKVLQVQVLGMLVQ